jgi:hypothetical protein
MSKRQLVLMILILYGRDVGGRRIRCPTSPNGRHHPMPPHPRGFVKAKPPIASSCARPPAMPGLRYKLDDEGERTASS